MDAFARSLRSPTRSPPGPKASARGTARGVVVAPANDDVAEDPLEYQRRRQQLAAAVEAERARRVAESARGGARVRRVRPLPVSSVPFVAFSLGTPSHDHRSALNTSYPAPRQPTLDSPAPVPRVDTPPVSMPACPLSPSPAELATSAYTSELEKRVVELQTNLQTAAGTSCFIC